MKESSVHSDPNILGGIVARVGDQVIDGSVRYRLSALQQQLLSGVSAARADSSTEELARLYDNDKHTGETQVSRPASTYPSQV